MRTTLAALTAATLLVAAAPPAVASPGALDASFSDDGKALLGFGGGYRNISAQDVLVKSSGKVVVVASLSGGGSTIFGTIRLREDGRPDPSFSGNGRRTTRFTGNDIPRRVVSLGNGRILVGGSAGGAFGLAAYLPDGSLDPSFGGDGRVTTDVTGGADEVRDLRVQEDGTILAAGFAGDQFAVVRYLDDGTPDTTFGDAGVVLTTDGFDGDPTTVRLQDDGKLVAVGVSPPNQDGLRGFAVSRYDVDGALDPTFGMGTGRVTTFRDEISTANAVVVQPDGKLLVGGEGVGEGDYSVAFLVRYLANGTLDPDFGTGGRVEHGPHQNAAINALALRGDGGIVSAGWTSRESNYEALLVTRYTAGGDLDPTFAGDGQRMVGFGPDTAVRAHAVALRHGRVVAAGEATAYFPTRPTIGVVVRLLQ